MGLPILNDVHDEITRLAVAGSALAAGDPRIKKYIPPLQKLGEKAPVFKTLAERLDALLTADSKDSPEALMDAGMLLYSLRYTQGTAETGAPPPETGGAPAWAQTPLPAGNIPYSELSPLIDRLTSGSMENAGSIEAVFEAGRHRDPRLFRWYCAAVGGKKTPISAYVAETVIPDIGAEIIPFAEAALDLQGGKGHARLLTAIYRLKGAAAIPLAERALAEGSEHVMAAAVRIFGEDPKYEEMLLSYTKDRKAGPKGAAFAALVKMGSAKGDEALLEALGKAAVGFLEDALTASRNPAVFEKVLAQAAALMPAYKDNAPKLKILLKVIADRDDEAGLCFLEKALTDKDFRSEAWNLLELGKVFEILMGADTKQKNEIVYRLAEKGGEALSQWKIEAAIRIFTAQEVYEKCHKGVDKNNCWHIFHAYNIEWGSNWTPDSKKTWDRRWAKHFVTGHTFDIAAAMLYNDDVETWTMMLDHVVDRIKKQTSSTHPYYSTTFVNILGQAFTNKHPKAYEYYEKFIAAGFPKKDLAPIIELEAYMRNP
ncbi:MAG: hypothetical protein LBD13_06015 [Spirochaetaceae bacterium]|jgi:hypothetical protein|nr:hypothetical protein [Spirochaetaceae bacterium]